MCPLLSHYQIAFWSISWPDFLASLRASPKFQWPNLTPTPNTLFSNLQTTNLPKHRDYSLVGTHCLVVKFLFLSVFPTGCQLSSHFQGPHFVIKQISRAGWKQCWYCRWKSSLRYLRVIFHKDIEEKRVWLCQRGNVVFSYSFINIGTTSRRGDSKILLTRSRKLD